MNPLCSFPECPNEHDPQFCDAHSDVSGPRARHALRRERIATAVLSGLAACSHDIGEPIKFAVAWADRLIAELDKEQKS